MPYGRTSTKTLTNFNDPNTSGVVSLPAGFKGSDLRFHGIIVPAGPVTLDQCVFKGPKTVPTTGDHALLRCYNKRTGQAVVTNSTFVPQTKGNSLNDVLGWQYELYHCDLSGGIDAAGIYVTSAAGSDSAKVIIEDSWLHDLSWTWPDKITHRADGSGTHSDVIQIQGGKDVTLRRLKLDAYVAVLPGTQVPADKQWVVDGRWAGAGITIQNNTGFPVEAIFEDIEVSGGMAQFNIKPNVKITMKNTRHHYDVGNHAANPKYSRYYIRFDKQSSNKVTGLETAVFVDGPDKGKRLLDTSRGVTTNA